MVVCGGLADSGAHPVVLAAGVQASKELCERAIPASHADVKSRLTALLSTHPGADDGELLVIAQESMATA